MTTGQVDVYIAKNHFSSPRHVGKGVPRRASYNTTVDSETIDKVWLLLLGLNGPRSVDVVYYNCSLVSWPSVSPLLPEKQNKKAAQDVCLPLARMALSGTSNGELLLC